MDFKSWPALFGTLGTFGLVAALFTVAVSPGSSPPPPAPSASVTEAKAAVSAQAEAKTACRRWCEPLRLFDEFFALRLPSGTETETPAASGIAERARTLGYTVDSLIVLIPDPLDSGLSYRANEALEALQSAFADSGYRFDRQWLPWEGKAVEERRYRREPGVLLFRHPAKDGRPQLTAAFLVGETPKGGVHKAALFEALDLIAALRGPDAGASGRIRILGPSFSGSAESLAIGLRRWLESGQRGDTFQLVTGTATDPALEQTFERFLPRRLLFERGIVSDDVLERQAFELLDQRMGWDLDDVALLSESDTAYGQSSRRRRSGFLYVEFPSRLAQIRAAREREGLQRKGSQTEDVVDPTRKSLDLSLGGEERSADTLPQFGTLGNPSNDLVLSNLLSTLARERTRYVGIRATDLRDRLFLVEQIRSYLPDVVVFTFDNHLLDAHPRRTRSMEGSLVLTGFPLYVARHEGEGWRYRRQAPSELAQGIRLAGRRLLMNEPLAAPRSWIVAVGNGRLWPVAVVGEGGGAPLPIAGSDIVRQTSKGPLTAVLIVALAVWLMSRAVPFQKAALSPGGTLVWRRGAVAVPLLGMAALALAAGTLTALFALPLFGGVPRLGTGGAFWALFPGLLFLTLVYGAAVWLCAWLAMAAFRPRRTLWEGVFRGLAWAAGALLLLVLLGGALRALWVIPEGAEHFAARVWTPASGLSPWPPLLLLLAAVWAWSLAELKRRQLILLQEVPWPLVHPPEPSLAAGEALAERLRGTLNRRLPGPVFWAILGVAFLIPLPRLLQGVQPITETALYGWVFVALVGFVFTLSAISFWRFFAAWRILERLLDRLCQSWLQPVFHAGAPEYDWKPMKSFGLRMPPFKMSLISVERLKVIARMGLLGTAGAELTGRPGVEKGVLDAGLERIYEADRRGAFLTEVEARCELRSWLSRSAHSLELWRTAAGGAEPPDTDLAGKVQPRARELELREIERYLAIRVVAWLRYAFAHLRASLLGALASGLLLLVAVSEYAFQPKRYLSFGIWVALLIGAVLTLRAFVQMDRNAALSSIGRTDAGKVSFDRTFFSNLFTYVGVPVLGVVLTQFPAVGSLLGDWLQPVLRLLAGG